MKILYACMKYDYGKPKQGYSFEHYNFYDSLKYMGFDLVYFDCMSILQKEGKSKMNEMLIETAKQEKPDLIFFSLMLDEFENRTLQYLSNETNFTTFNWFCDDHWRYNNFSKHKAPHFNWVSTTDQGSIEKYQRDGFQNVLKTQWGFNPNIYNNKNLEYKYDVTFVGQVHSNRKPLIKSLQKAGINIQCFGKGWENGRVSQDEMIDIFNSSKINLNLNNSSTNKWFRFWKKDRPQIKGRNFEVPGTGGFLLTGEADNLNQYFEYDKEIAVYNDEKDLEERIIYYLENESERKSIAKKGLERSIAEHSYVVRFGEIFSKIFGKESI